MLKQLLHGLLSRVYIWHSKFAGKKIYIKEKFVSDDLTNIRVIMSDDITINIKVLKHSYLVEYDKDIVTNKKHDVFEIWGILPERVSRTVSDIYADPVYIPRLLPKHFDLDSQIKEAVKAFLDIKRKAVSYKSK